MSTITDPMQSAHDVYSAIGEDAVSCIEGRNFMSLGSGLGFNSTLLPFSAPRVRSWSPVEMFIEIQLTNSGIYEVTVTYFEASTLFEHFKMSDVAADQLKDLICAINHNGPETLDPMIWDNAALET